MFSFQGTSSNQTRLISFPSSAGASVENCISSCWFSSPIKTHFVGLLIGLGTRISIIRNSMKFQLRWNFSQSLKNSMVESTGIEPVTSCLQGRRSPSWANPPYFVRGNGGPGLAFLRKSHSGCNSPPDCCQEPPFESILAWSPSELNRLGLDSRFWLILEVVGQNGLEPSTSRLSVVCSSQLSYWPISASTFLSTHSCVPSKLNNALSHYTLYWP